MIIKRSKRVALFASVVGLSLSLLVAPTASASTSSTDVVTSEGAGAGSVTSREAAGKYEYICLAINGSSYSMPRGAKLSTCKGSYLQQYINGRQIARVSLTGEGKPAAPKPANKLDCVVSVIGAGASAASIVISGGVLSYIGGAVSAYGLKACVA